MKLLTLPAIFILCVTAGAAEKERCLELRLRDVREEMIAAVKNKGVKSLKPWHDVPEHVIPPPGAVDYFRREGMDVMGQLSGNEVYDACFTVYLKKNDRGAWDLGIFRESQELHRIFDAAEVRRFLKRGDHAFVSVSYSYIGIRCVTDVRGFISFPCFSVSLSIDQGEGERARPVGRIVIGMPSGLDPVDATDHLEGWDAKKDRAIYGRKMPGDGRIATFVPKGSEIRNDPMLHDARTGKAMPSFRIWDLYDPTKPAAK